MTSGAEAEYRSRLAVRQTALDRAIRHADRLGNLRLLLALSALALILLPLFVRHGAPWWGLLPVAVAFVFLGRALDRAFRERRSLEAAVRYYKDGLSRLEETWSTLADQGNDVGARYKGGDHPADDLDLFGPASLFQLLCRAFTADGRRALAKAIAEPAGRSTIEARQPAGEELSVAIDVRESLSRAAAGEDPGHVDDRALLDWAEAKGTISYAGFLRVLALIQPLILIVTIVLYYAIDLVPPLALASFLQLITLFATRRMTAPRAQVLAGPDRVLERYAQLIAVLEAMPVKSPLLVEIQGRLKSEGEAAAARVGRLHTLVEYLDWRLNPFFGLTFAPALLFELNLVLATERWRLETGPRLRGWLAAIGEVEMLASFGAFRYERADYTYPRFLDGPLSFSADGLAHPLIDRRRVAANDLTLAGPGSVLLLSGSNMSGKSTLLRAVGLNVLLAHAGAPVAARRLELSEMEIATSVRIVDSLAAGTSHFYAELKRLKTIVDRASGEKPLLYLLDEMLHGTNSRERYVGAVTVIRWLASTGAMGIVTTHDLSLAEVAKQLPAGKAKNQHFSDEVRDGKIHFDYRLRDGPIQSTNALRLMREVGIDLDFEAATEKA